jgi:hypothetical protein
MAFTDNTSRHSFPHRVSTGYELDGVTFGPEEITLGHSPGSIIADKFEDGVIATRRKRIKIRTFGFKYPLLHDDEWPTLWKFYDTLAEQIQYYFYINLYYFEPTKFTNEWIGVNFQQEMNLRVFVPVVAEVGFTLIENIQATLTHTTP